MKKKLGRLIVISAPSGCGKTTIVDRLLNRNKNLTRSISYTTRAPRPGEKDGHDYYFITADEFRKKMKRRFFLEWAQVFDRFYGSAKLFVRQVIHSGNDCILAIDVQGMKHVLARAGKQIPVLTLFIMPPSLRALKRRLAKRKTETPAEIAGRFAMAEHEMNERHLYDFVVVNHKVDQAVKEVERILK